MRAIVLNTGTEILLGDVINTHLSVIAREILPLGLRVECQIAVPDGNAIRDALRENCERADLIFVTGGLGPTTDDLTREITAELLGLELEFDPALAASITERLTTRGIRLTDRILRQAQVPRGALVLPNENGSASGLYLAAGLNRAMMLRSGRVSPCRVTCVHCWTTTVSARCRSSESSHATIRLCASVPGMRGPKLTWVSR